MQALHAGVEPGVHLYFAGKLMHGARVSKLGTASLDAFGVLPRLRQGQRSPAIPATLDYRQSRQQVNLAVLPLYPGIQATQVHTLLSSGVEGVLIECYGSGTGPADDADLLKALQDAHQTEVEHWFALDLCGERVD